MSSIFFRIYLGLLFASVVIATGAAGIHQYWQSERVDRYLADNMEGTLTLISEGLARHDSEQESQWLTIARRVTSLPIEVFSRDELPDSVPLSDAEGPFLSHSDSDGNRLFTLVIPDADKAIMQVSVRETDVNEQFMRGTMLLLLNELGRYPKDDRQQELQRVQALFHFPLSWLTADNLKTNYLQKRVLKRKETVVDFFTQDDGSRAMRAIAPIGNSGEFLQIGPVPLLNDFPRSFVVVMGAVCLVLLTIIGFLLVRPLESRLNRMAREVDAIGMGGEAEPLTLEGHDGLTALAGKINQMSGRIYQLLQTQKELNRAVSHELKTPLARLRFRRELAVQRLEQLESKLPFDSDLDLAPVRQHLTGMENSIEELNHLVEEILLYARLESAEPDMKFETCRLDEIVNDLVQPLQNQFPDMIFSVDLTEEQTVWADRHQLKRAVQNLLVNAQRFASRQVVVTTFIEDNQSMIRVEDDGPGIPEEQWEEVLKPFSRVETSRNRQTGGTGLGLAIVSQIMHWHHGGVRIGRSRLGGACATLSLPEPCEQA